jgi:hypothetical protein
VEELMLMNENYENDPIQEKLEYLKEFEVKLPLMISHNLDKSDAQIKDVEIDAKNGMVNLKALILSIGSKKW